MTKVRELARLCMWAGIAGLLIAGFIVGALCAGLLASAAWLDEEASAFQFGFTATGCAILALAAVVLALGSIAAIERGEEQAAKYGVEVIERKAEPDERSPA